MSTSERQEKILEILREEGFLSVELLAQKTYTSPSSIRRDLTRLQNMGFVKRTHGGAGILGENGQAVPLTNRMTQNTTGKRKIAKIAASLLRDGQSIMLDGSSTASFLIPHIAKHKDVTLFTNNMATAMNAINFGIPTHCIGGASVNGSAVLSGEESYRAVMEINPDILFFSSHGIDADGIITDPTQSENHLRRLMISRAKRSVFLCDSEKFNKSALYTLASINDIDIAVFDEPWSELRAECEIMIG